MVSLVHGETPSEGSDTNVLGRPKEDVGDALRDELVFQKTMWSMSLGAFAGSARRCATDAGGLG